MAGKGSRSRVVEWRTARSLAGEARAGSHSRRLLLIEQRQWLRAHIKTIVIVVLVGAGFIALTSVFMPDPVLPYWQAAIGASIPWLIYTVMLQSGGMIPKMAGIQAEERTAEEIRQLRGEGWRLVNHVMLDKADIDHVALGPGGYLAIETKYRADWNYSKTQVQEFIRQAKPRAKSLAVRIARTEKAQPMLVLWGRGADEIVPGPVEWDGVIVCPGEQIASYLSSLPATRTSAEIAGAFDSLTKYVRHRDIGEARDWADLPRRADAMFVDVIAAVAAICVGLLVPSLLAEHLRPEVWWGAGGAASLAMMAALARRRWRQHHRLRVMATSLMVPALLWVVVIGAAIVYELVA